MPKVKVTRFADLGSDEVSHLQLSRHGGLALAAIEYLFEAEPGWTDYKGMVAECCEAAEPLTHELFARNYKTWLLRIDLKRNLEMKRRWPNYTLANELERQQLLGPLRIENVFPLSESERRAGLFLIAEDKFCEACWFMTRNALSIAILSQREEFLCAETLTLAYKAAAFDQGGEPNSWLNWSALSAAFCPLGDVIVKTCGAFDDRKRAVNFVFDPENPVVGPIGV
jgi:hypothetical protein